jgi:hypothetical protein
LRLEGVRAGPPGPDPNRLALECRVFTRYLAGVDATDYVVARYVAAHETLRPLVVRGRFDRLLLRLALWPAPARWPTAAFARVHAPDSALQNKLVTLLAILETVPPSSLRIDAAPSSSAAWLIVLLGTRSLMAVAALLVGTAVLVPLRWALADRAGGH